MLDVVWTFMLDVVWTSMLDVVWTSMQELGWRFMAKRCLNFANRQQNRVIRGGVVTRVESTVYVVDKRNQRNYVGYVCLVRTLSTPPG